MLRRRELLELHGHGEPTPKARTVPFVSCARAGANGPLSCPEACGARVADWRQAVPAYGNWSHGVCHKNDWITQRPATLGYALCNSAVFCGTRYEANSRTLARCGEGFARWVKGRGRGAKRAAHRAMRCSCLAAFETWRVRRGTPSLTDSSELNKIEGAYAPRSMMRCPGGRGGRGGHRCLGLAPRERAPATARGVLTARAAAAAAERGDLPPIASRALCTGRAATRLQDEGAASER